jgi:hypothetical protein
MRGIKGPRSGASQGNPMVKGRPAQVHANSEQPAVYQRVAAKNPLD